MKSVEKDEGGQGWGAHFKHPNNLSYHELWSGSTNQARSESPWLSWRVFRGVTWEMWRQNGSSIGEEVIRDGE